MGRLIARIIHYGWHPDLPDQRDFAYSLIAPKPEKFPKKVDFRENCSPVEDQGKLGSCTANALVGNLEFLKLKTFKKSIDFSRLFLYYNERVIERTVKSDSGASLRDGIKTLVKSGDCPEKLWPYIIKNFAKKPSADCYEKAMSYQITSYYRLHTIAEMKDTLNKSYPFVFGFSVFKSFESREVSETGIVPMPKIKERLLGGHAVMAVGYDDRDRRFIVRNSWGPDWGDHGYFYMPYGYLDNPDLASDFWTIRGME